VPQFYLVVREIATGNAIGEEATMTAMVIREGMTLEAVIDYDHQMEGGLGQDGGRYLRA